jgi:predicted nicotinamide N-methyase
MPIELKGCVKTIDLGDKLITMRVIEDLEPLLARVEVDEDIPFWAELWPSALGLARFLWQQIELQGKSTLELGAGLGLPGITAALKGAHVVETDLVAASLEWARANAQLNGLFDLEYLTADWRDFRVAGKYEVILGSDVLYEPKQHPMLEQILEAYLLPMGRAYLADPGREGASTFLERLTGKGWIVNTTEVTVEMDKYRNGINLYSLQREGKG